jgi:hypothetical protein
MRVKTNVKAGEPPPETPQRTSLNHNEALVRARGLKVKTSVKAGSFPPGPT